MCEAWGFAFHRLKLDLKRKRSVYYWWKFRLTNAIPIDLIKFVTQADYFCWKMFHVEFQPAENFPFQLINSPLIDAYCPLIECSRYVIVRRCSDLCAFDRMHCLIWIKFCEARGIYPIAHAVGLWSVCLCISFTTTENVRVWRIVQDGMNRSHCKESKPSKNSSQSCDMWTIDFVCRFICICWSHGWLEIIWRNTFKYHSKLESNLTLYLHRIKLSILKNIPYSNSNS